MDITAYKDIFGIREFTSIAKLRIGAVVQFTYDNEQKYAVVLNPDWQGKMHALSLKDLSKDSLELFLEETKEIASETELYDRYKASQYTESRPYRTYTISKIKALREVYLKQIVSISDELKLYSYVREFSSQELENEIGEYFENEYTYTKFPNLANTPEELGDMLTRAKRVVLTKSELLSLDNSDVGDVLNSKNPMQSAKKVATDNERDINRILSAIQSNIALPMPIIIRYSGGNYLMAGNTRLCSMAGLGYTMPVKMIRYR
jgi:signal recognition particle subunit SEC65